ncbi:hypothetical protein LV779_06975 [Streptomyces thinghirensis]|nr:hypothetical protein [Streptomyces thinghirensis]
MPGRAAAVPPPVGSGRRGQGRCAESYGGQTGPYAGGPAPAVGSWGRARPAGGLLAIQGSAGNAAASLLTRQPSAPRPPDAAGGPLVVARAPLAPVVGGARNRGADGGRPGPAAPPSGPGRPAHPTCRRPEHGAGDRETRQRPEASAAGTAPVSDGHDVGGASPPRRG